MSNIFSNDCVTENELIITPGAPIENPVRVIRADEVGEEAIKKGDYCASQGPILHGKRDGNKLIINTTPVSKIGTVSNAAWLPDRVIRGENLTHFEYEIRSIEKWVRVEVTDNEGKKAWSNIFTSDK